MRFLIICLFILSGSLTTYFATASSSDFSARLTEQQTEQLEQAQKAVWRINGHNINGTAFFVSPNHIVTNWHVIYDQNISSLSLQREGSERKLLIKRLISVSALYDLALLEVGEDSKSYLEVRKDLVSSEEGLVLLGYPNGVFRYTLKTSPLKSFKDNIFTYFFVNRIDLRGNSGGPVLDARGEVAGVTGPGVVNYMSMIKGNVLRDFIDGDIGLRCGGWGPRVCIKEDLNNLQKQARKGNQIAQHQLALMYCHGLGVQQDLSLAFYWYYRSAEQGYAPAQHVLGIMYYKGKGVQQDLYSTLYWYHHSAKQGYALAQYNLGVMYYKGEGVQQNLSSALKWFHHSAEQGNVSAQYNLGVMYRKGEGVQQNLSSALKWFHRSAGSGYARALHSLEVMQDEGKRVRNLSSVCHKVFE